ncbi:ElyC/SanA/YdcF family protein [Kibdelosporangium lantanae]|uniref:ElyC/SanA/YdcF family protein n=1 Tax=Kibdelosporangium lantanae TaxID=1497396 RepID=A0ABW3MLE7_9PSEU
MDTYDTCARAVQVFGVRRALLVTQSYHLPRAVALCRSLGMDADGVAAPCDCNVFSLVKNRAREWLATVDAVREAIWHRDPAVTSPPDDTLAPHRFWVHERGGGPKLYTNRTREVAVR